MKRLLIFTFLVMTMSVCIKAQSSMTDNQVMAFVVKEHEAGTSQAQIVTKLMQRGVDIQQIRRVRRKYENEKTAWAWSQLTADRLPTTACAKTTANIRPMIWTALKTHAAIPTSV